MGDFKFAPTLDIGELAKLFEENEVAIFCGAGISIGAGIPAARELKKNLIGSCTSLADEVELLVNSDLALETIMDIFSAYTDISPVLDIFEGSQPYLAHLFVARLVNHRLVRDVGTTNFDRLFESAYDSASGKAFCLCCENSHTHDASLPSLFNIHGSIDRRDSIMVRLHDVASGRWNQAIVDSLRHLFSTGHHHYVMVMGYSFSDRFDVNPILATFNPRKKIIFIQNASGLLEPEVIDGLPEPVRHYGGFTLRVDTDAFIVKLWNELEEKIGNPTPVEKDSSRRWVDKIVNWKLQVSNGNGHLASIIMGRLFEKFPDYDRAEQYYEHVPAMTTDVITIARSHILRGGTKLNRVQYESAEQAISQGLSFLPDAADLIKKEQVERGLLDVMMLGSHMRGVALMYLGQEGAHYDHDMEGALAYYSRAETCFENAHEFAERLGSLASLGFVNLGMGTVHLNHADSCKTETERNLQLELALGAYRQALGVSVKEGDPYLQADVFDGYGKVFRRQGRLGHAVRVHELALRLAKNLADDRRISIKLLSLAKDFQLAFETSKELKCRLEADVLLAKVGDLRTANENRMRIELLQKGNARNARLRLS